jgi:hypothetical protein
MSQPELSFDAPEPQGGYDRWQQDRQAAKRELAQRLGLPLGHQVEVWLRGEVRLRGRLDLAEEKLFVPEGNDPHLRLAIGRTSFEAGEIESCVRTD